MKKEIKREGLNNAEMQAVQRIILSANKQQRKAIKEFIDLHTLI